MIDRRIYHGVKEVFMYSRKVKKGYVLYENEKGPRIGTAGDKVLVVEGCVFKDLAGTGELLPYEDWRLPYEARARDLAARLPVEMIAGLMLYSPHQMVPGLPGSPFPGTYKGQIFAVSLASIIIAPTIASTTAKSAVLIPIINNISDEMGYAPQSKGATGLISCCNTVTNCCGPMFMTGGIVATLMLSMYTGTIGWGDYFLFALVWGVIVFVGTVAFHLFYYNPEKGVPKDQVKVLGKDVIQSRINALGKMSRNEIVALIVLIAAVALWITEGVHGIPTAVVAVGVWVVLCAFGMFSTADFNSGKMMWSVWAMVAAVLGVVDLMSDTGLSAWIGDLVAPAVEVFASSPALVVIACSVLSTLLMMALVNYLVFAALAIALLAAVPMDPLCILFPICMSGMVFILPPQNVPMLAAEGLSAGRMLFKDTRPAAYAYVVCCLVGCIASIPWWSMLGYIY